MQIFSSISTSLHGTLRLYYSPNARRVYIKGIVTPIVCVIAWSSGYRHQLSLEIGCAVPVRFH